MTCAIIHQPIRERGSQAGPVVKPPAESGELAAGAGPTAAIGVWLGAWSSSSLALDDVLAYQRDVWERIILFWDTVRQRADNMIAHERAGKPPLLDFDYEVVLDARRFKRSVNYALLRITRYDDKCLEDCLDPAKPPVMIVDPRAGHGPGIGVFKRESEVGIAMHEGYPVYFVVFFPEPAPGQTMADVLHTLRRFVEECPNCVIDLRRIHNPLVIFASYGDNITPPHQALGWISTVYSSTDDLKRAGQRIVYLINPHVGHLGIFVSASVARLEHRAILESLKRIEILPLGLYEMKIDNTTGDPDCGHDAYSVRFEERCVEDLKFPENRPAFRHVAEVSAQLDIMYSATLGKLIEATATPLSAQWLEWLHPMRVSCYMFATEFNPWLRAIAPVAASVARERHAVPDTNLLKTREIEAFAAVYDLVSRMRERRDQGYELWFEALYGKGAAAGSVAASPGPRPTYQPACGRTT